MLNCTSLLFGIVCTQQSCTLLEYCTRLTYSKVFHFFEMFYMWCVALLLWYFTQVTMVNCTALLLEIDYSQQSYVLLEYVFCLIYSKAFHFFWDVLYVVLCTAVVQFSTIYYAKLHWAALLDSPFSTELRVARIRYLLNVFYSKASHLFLMCFCYLSV